MISRAIPSRLLKPHFSLHLTHLHSPRICVIRRVILLIRDSILIVNKLFLFKMVTANKGLESHIHFIVKLRLVVLRANGGIEYKSLRGRYLSRR